MMGECGSFASCTVEMDITRILDASPEVVWSALTKAECIKHWWGPKGFTAPVVEIDLRVGGRFLLAMRGPDGKDYWNTGTFEEIKAPERLVKMISFADSQGHAVPATYYGLSADFPMQSKIEINLEKYGEKQTRMSLYYDAIATEDYDNAAQGWGESLDKLEKYLEAKK
jgi:uncharacterized protein YndB with AHSA1/START domain